MGKQSSGILLYRWKVDKLELLLVHPGGPFWQSKDAGAWSIPKGEFTEDEDPLDAARREFEEEIGFQIRGDCLELSPIKQKGGKVVYAWACEGDLDPNDISSNSFELEWPPHSGQIKKFPEIDRGAWFTPSEAKNKINTRQVAFIDEILKKLDQQ